MPRGKFSPELKRKIVEEHVAGGKPISSICRSYSVGETAVRHWVQQYREAGDAGLANHDASVRELREAQQRIEELEGALGRASMELDFMRRAFKRAGLPFPNVPRS